METHHLDPDTLEWVVTVQPERFKQGDVIRCINIDGNADKLALDMTYLVLRDWQDMPIRQSFMGLPLVAIPWGVFYADRFVLHQAANNAPPLIP
jgi:hypothetical protein